MKRDCQFLSHILNQPKLHENQHMRLTQGKKVNASETRIGFSVLLDDKVARVFFLSQSLSAAVIKRSMADQMQLFLQFFDNF